MPVKNTSYTVYPVPLQTDQGIKNLMSPEAAQLATSDPDYAIRDLYNNISEGNPASWTFYIQVMTFEEAEQFRWNPFDLTKVSMSLAPGLLPFLKI